MLTYTHNMELNTTDVLQSPWGLGDWRVVARITREGEITWFISPTEEERDQVAAAAKVFAAK